MKTVKKVQIPKVKSIIPKMKNSLHKLCIILEKVKKKKKRVSNLEDKLTETSLP